MTNHERWLLTHFLGMSDPRSVKILEHVCYFDSSAAALVVSLGGCGQLKPTVPREKKKSINFERVFLCNPDFLPRRGSTFTHFYQQHDLDSELNFTVNSGGAPDL